MLNQYRVPQLPGHGKNKGLNKNKNKNMKVMTPGRIILLTFLSLLFLFFLLVYLFLAVYKPAPDPAPDVDWGNILGIGVSDGEDGDAGEAVLPENLTGDRNPDCYTFLILGSDNGLLTDTIMFAMFNAKENTISILNIPRDTYVNTGNDSGRINGIYAKGRARAIRAGTPRGEEANKAGIEYLKAMIQYTFGIPVQYHVLINLDGFKYLVDAIDGVEMYVPQDMNYSDPEQGLYINLKEGFQKLNGEKAEQLVRFRKGYVSQDIGRIETQQKFMAALMKKLLKFDLKNINALFDTASRYMNTNISTANAAWFAAKAVNVKLEDMRTHTIPGNWISSVLRFEVYKPEAMEIINKYYNPYKIDIPELNFNIYDKDLIGWNGYKPEIDIDGMTMDKLAN